MKKNSSCFCTTIYMIFLTLQPDKRTLKRKVDQGTSSDSTSTDNDIGGSSSASGSSADHEEIGDSEETNNSGDTESVEESDENEGMHYTVKYICMPPKKHLPPKCNEIVSEECTHPRCIRRL